MKKQIIFINSHPIQYFAPLYKFMNNNGIKTSCWYCSDESLQGGHDAEFGTDVQWDVPLLAGYNYRFFKNHSRKPSYNNGFFGLVNTGMIRELFKISKSIIVIHGYHYFTLTCLLLLGKMCGHTICLRCESPQNQEVLKTGWKQQVKQITLKYILFPRIHYFLYIGSQNRLFYKSFGIKDKRLIACPYSVDNERFRKEAEILGGKKATIKQRLGIPLQSKIIVYSAKYIKKKRPLDILKAFAQLSSSQLWLVMVGEGELRPQMEEYIQSAGLQNVTLTGFVNQSRIPEYYAISDLFVMCSGVGETWGLSANEAMNFGLPLVLSQLSGCSIDLVEPGVNGYTFTTGDVAELAEKLKFILLENRLTNPFASIDIVNRFSYNTIAENLGALTA